MSEGKPEGRLRYRCMSKVVRLECFLILVCRRSAFGDFEAVLLGISGRVPKTRGTARRTSVEYRTFCISRRVSSSLPSPSSSSTCCCTMISMSRSCRGRVRNGDVLGMGAVCSSPLQSRSRALSPTLPWMWSPPLTVPADCLQLRVTHRH